MQPAFSYLDIAGYNYRLDKYESDHAKYPDRVMMGTESFPGAVYKHWDFIEKSSWVIGDFAGPRPTTWASRDWALLLFGTVLAESLASRAIPGSTPIAAI